LKGFETLLSQDIGCQAAIQFFLALFALAAAAAFGHKRFFPG
jgi:hypothetical protein